MADDLKRVGLVFKADGAVDFKRSLQEINTAITENKNSFKLAQSQWDENTSSLNKLADKQKYLSSQTDAYSDRVDVLSKELKELENAETRNESAIRKKHNQLTQAQIQLSKYQKELSGVTDELENGTAEAEEELGKLADTMQDLTTKSRENESAFNALQSEYNDGTKSLVKYKDQQSYLAQQMDNYGSQVKNLERQLEIMENAENRNERAISEKRAELNQAKTVMNGYGKKLEEVERKLKDGSAATEDFKNSMEEASSSVKEAGDKMGGISTAAAGIIGAVAATVPATEEYRKIMGSLEISSEKAGYSAEQTRESYQELYGVLGDDQTAATTTANLQALGLEQEELNELINGTIGAWATYGDSIPIDSLAEAINETIKVGKVTGTFADMLNWAGTSEDEFNGKLAKCKTESEKVDLVMQEMAKQGLTQAGEKWKEQNKALVEGNKATAEFQSATSELAELVSPIISRITELMTKLVTKFLELPSSTQNVILGFVGFIAVISPLLNGISGIVSWIGKLPGLFQGTAGEAGKTGGILSSLWGIMKAHPIGALVAIIGGALVGAFIWLWNNCESFREFWINLWEKIKAITKTTVDAVSKFFQNLWNKTKEIFNGIKNTATSIWTNIKTAVTGKVQEIKNKCSEILGNIKAKFSEIWNSIKSTVSNLIQGIKSAITSGIEGAKSSASRTLEAIKSKFSSIFESAKTIVKKAIDKIKGFFNFSWSLPKIKLPHFSIKGKFNLNPPSIPSFGVSWYAKGGILNKPTIFGRSGDNLLGGGEAGKEAVLPISLLKDYIREENRANNGILVGAIKEAMSELNLVAENNIYIGDRKVADVLTDMVTKKVMARTSQYNTVKGRYA